MKKTILIIAGFLLGLATTVSAATLALPPNQGGTGTSTKPTYGQLLVGQANGTYNLQATSTLGISGGSGTMAIGGTVTSGVATNLLFINPTATLAQDSTLQIVNDYVTNNTSYLQVGNNGNVASSRFSLFDGDGIEKVYLENNDLSNTPTVTLMAHYADKVKIGNLDTTRIELGTDGNIGLNGYPTDYPIHTGYLTANTTLTPAFFIDNPAGGNQTVLGMGINGTVKGYFRADSNGSMFLVANSATGDVDFRTNGIGGETNMLHMSGTDLSATFYGTVSTTGLITSSWKPTSDSTTALNIYKANGTTNVAQFDTTNSYSTFFGTVKIPTANALVLGAGDGGTPTATTIRGAAASGTSVAGKNMTFDASNGTGSAGSGAFIWRTAPAGIADIVITGTVTPDSTGQYAYKGQYNGYNYYQRGTDSWYVFYKVDSWVISATLGGYTTDWYKNSVASTPIGLINFTAHIGSSGSPSVAAATANTPNTLTEAMRIDQNGNLIEQIGIQTPKIFPLTDSTTALQINKADGTTNVLNVDTTNSRIGIGTTSPFTSLGVAGTITANNINATSTTATSTFSGDVKANNYFSSDGTKGYTGTCTLLSITSIVVKNGLIVSCN